MYDAHKVMAVQAAV